MEGAWKAQAHHQMKKSQVLLSCVVETVNQDEGGAQERDAGPFLICGQAACQGWRQAGRLWETEVLWLTCMISCM